MLKLFKRSYWSIFSSRLLYLLCVFLMFGCASEPKKVAPYRGRVAQQAERTTETTNSSKYARAANQKDMSDESDKNAIKYPAVQHIRTGEDVLMSSLKRINDRIFVYEEKLTAFEKISNNSDKTGLVGQQMENIRECQQRVKNILSAYNMLHEKILSKQSVIAEDLMGKESLFVIEKQDFDYLESDCNDMLDGRKSGPDALSVNNDLGALRLGEELIAKADANQDYQEVINTFEGLPDKQQNEISYKTQFLYGRALMKNDRQEEAVKVLSDLISRYHQKHSSKWEFELMGLLGDLLFGLEKYEQAGIQYDRLLKQYSELSVNYDWANKQLFVINQKGRTGEELSDYALLLKSYLSYNANRDGYRVVFQARNFLEKYSNARISYGAEFILQRAEELAEEWFAGLLEEIEFLSVDNKIQEAVKMIEQVPVGLIPQDKQLLLKSKRDELLLAQSRASEEEKRRQEEVQPLKWNRGMELMEARKYDEAIEIFKELLNTPYDERVRNKIDESVELAVREDRRKAAELFVRANRTNDVEVKKKLLLDSRQLLKSIMEKYPQSDLIEKVTKNLKSIEDEIYNLDASLLEDTYPAEGSQMQKDGLEESKTLPLQNLMSKDAQQNQR